MKDIEQRIEGIIQTIPDQPLNLVVSDRFIVLSHLDNALRNGPQKKLTLKLLDLKMT